MAKKCLWIKLKRELYSSLILKFTNFFLFHQRMHYRGFNKSLARPGRKHATATEDFDVHISHS